MDGRSFDSGESLLQANTDARAVLVGRLASIGARDARNGYGDLADKVANGQPAEIPSWVVLDLLEERFLTPPGGSYEEGK